MPRLFTYILRYDDGAAPNPFYGMCSLTICKPRIRSVAQIGDWIAGFGSQGTQYAEKLIYAMKVNEVVTLEKYDDLALFRWPHRIPKANSPFLVERLGDCIYDYSKGPSPILRFSVHSKDEIDNDLSGKSALISYEYFYFGNKAIELPEHLKELCNIRRGHKSNKNEPYYEQFIEWIENFEYSYGQHGWPTHINSECSNSCSTRNIEDDDYAMFEANK